MVELYMDHHVPAAITEGLRMRGVNVLTAQEDGSAALDDDPLLDRATSLGRVLFSQDEDLLAIAHRRLKARVDFAGVVYAHQLAISIGQAVRRAQHQPGINRPDRTSALALPAGGRLIRRRDAPAGD